MELHLCDLLRPEWKLKILAYQTAALLDCLTVNDHIKVQCGVTMDYLFSMSASRFYGLGFKFYFLFEVCMFCHIPKTGMLGSCYLFTFIFHINNLL